MFEETIYTVYEEKIYTFVGKYGENSVTKEIEVKLQSSVTDIQSSDIETTIAPSEITNQNVTVTIKNKRTAYILQYSLDGTSWENYSTPLIMTQNGPIYVRLANESGEGGNYITINITNIDKLAPNTFAPTATATTNSITLTGSTTDATKTSANASSGIKAYYFSKDNGTSWVGGTTSTSYTFTGLTQGTEYNLKMKAVDNAGNETITSTVSKTTKSVTELTTSNTTFTYSTTEWTKENVDVIITTTITEYTLQYSLDATTWTNYTETITMTQNGPIYARVVDSIGTAAKGYATGNVANIDKLAPNTFTPSATVTSNSITITGSTTDVEETSTNGCSGIKVYYFSKDNGASWGGGTTSTSYTFKGLTQETEYSLKMKAIDNAGNEIITETVTKQTLKALPEFSYTGTYEIVNDDDTAYTEGNENWKIRFLTSGTLTFTSLNGASRGIDAFLVGGGGSGSKGVNTETDGCNGAGGGGGYTKTIRDISVLTGTSYDITVGSGGANTSAFDYVANKGGNAQKGSHWSAAGGNGGSGGGGNSGNGGSDGSNGTGSVGGTGQGTTTREFGESTGTIYANGGNGGKTASKTGSAGAANTGNGGEGGGYSNKSGGAGGSGIVIIRNTRYDLDISNTTIPEFTYTGRYEIVDDDDNFITSDNSTENWRIRFLTSGTLIFTDLKGASDGIDAFLVGGGGSGSKGINTETDGCNGAGGGGGYTTTIKDISVLTDTSYDIIVGSGGADTSAFDYVAKRGGNAQSGSHWSAAGGNGGSGGGGNSGNGGSDGSDGTGSVGGTGQGTTTREFGESTGTIYAKGGDGGKISSKTGSAGRENTGNGGEGGGYSNKSGGTGGSGIVIIRNAR